MPVDEAKAMGATALFGEKYGDVVRVVKMGDVSTELCGGTHLDNTAKVGAFRIVSEGSVASGVRRIEAIVGKEYLKAAIDNEAKIAKTAEVIKAKPAELAVRAEALMAELKEMRQEIERMKDQALAAEVDRLIASAKEIGGVKVLTAERNDLVGNDLRKFGDFLRDKDESIVAVLSSASDAKVTFVASCGKAAVAKGLKAGDIIRSVCAVAGGKGGGKPDSAMGGGTDVSKVNEALSSVEAFVSEK